MAESSTAVRLCDEYLSLLNLIRGWAGTRYNQNKKLVFDLYKNDLLIADNTIRSTFQTLSIESLFGASICGNRN